MEIIKGSTMFGFSIVNSSIVDLENEWKSWFPDIDRIEQNISALEAPLKYEQKNSKEAKDLYVRLSTLKEQVDHSYTKKCIQALQPLGTKMRPIGIKYLNIQVKILRSFLPSSLFEFKQHSLLHIAPITVGLILGSYLSSTCRYAALASITNFVLYHTLSRKLPKIHFGPYFHPLLTTGIGPVVEEFFFRGILQNSVKWITDSTIAGITLSAILFGAHHLIHFPKKHAALLTIRSITYGVLNHKLGLHAAIIAHACDNLLAIVTPQPGSS